MKAQKHGKYPFPYSGMFDLSRILHFISINISNITCQRAHRGVAYLFVCKQYIVGTQCMFAGQLLVGLAFLLQHLAIIGIQKCRYCRLMDHLKAAKSKVNPVFFPIMIFKADLVQLQLWLWYWVWIKLYFICNSSSSQICRQCHQSLWVSLSVETEQCWLYI